ncbi:MAG TPA: FAD-dependent oxidoreductase [Longimicrobiales bacterium]
MAELPEGEPVHGKIGDDAVMLVRHGSNVAAFSGQCTHYSGPLAEGLVTGDVVRCPWHHACFSLRSGEAIAAPALNPLPRYAVSVRAGVAYVGERMEADPLQTHGRASDGPSSVVIVGAGAAGSAAAEMLRRQGYTGRVIMVDPDRDAPYDRPNLSKDYLAGTAEAEWLPLRPQGFYEEHDIERITARVAAVEPARHRVTLEDGREVEYGKLLLATGASPIKPPIPGADQSHVHVLRTLADCEALLQSVSHARHVLVAGASFIGMEVAASLRHRGLEVTVVAPEAVPFERVLGAAVGRHLRGVHENAGVRFRLGHTVQAIGAHAVTLDDGSSIPCDVVVLGIGVRPLLALAQDAGLQIDNGVVVDDFLETSAADVYAAGDIARIGGRRVEHWVVAQRMGQAAARNILGQRVRHEAVPFFWTQQFDVPVAYVGHAMSWDEIDVKGSIERNDCSVSYRKGGEVLAVVTIGRDLESLRAEVTMERGR